MDIPSICRSLGAQKVEVKDPSKPMPVEWLRLVDLDASSPGDSHYTADLKQGSITFGDGYYGKIPPKGVKNIRVIYTTSNGEAGNVLPHTIKGIRDKNLALKVKVTNKKAASGGKDPETLSQAILRLRKDLATIHRAITPLDYEQLVLDMPGKMVARVKAIPSYHPHYTRDVPGLVTVAVVPGEAGKRNVFQSSLLHGWGFLPTGSLPHDMMVQGAATQELLLKVYLYLEKRRLLTTRLLVIPADYQTVKVISTVIINPEYLRSTVEKAVSTAIDSFFHPLNGGPDSTGWPFGRRAT